MDLTTVKAFANHTWQTPFLDHEGHQAMSLTYPVPEPVRTTYQTTTRDTPGLLETHLNYPCMQIYLTSSDSLFYDRESQEFTCQAVAELTRALSIARFFTVFPGIRFEIYDGRAAFETRKSLTEIAEHSIREREARNTPVSTPESGESSFNTPFLPVSFYSPPNCPYHGVVLTSSDISHLVENLQFMYFNEETPMEDVDIPSNLSFEAFSCALRSVFVRKKGEKINGRSKFFAILGSQFLTVGLGDMRIPQAVRDFRVSAAKFWVGDEACENVTKRLRSEEIVREEIEIAKWAALRDAIVLD